MRSAGIAYYYSSLITHVITGCGHGIIKILVNQTQVDEMGVDESGVKCLESSHIMFPIVFFKYKYHKTVSSGFLLFVFVVPTSCPTLCVHVN